MSRVEIGEIGRVDAPSRRARIVLGEFLTWPLVVSHGGIAPPSSMIFACFGTRHSVAGARPGGRGRIPLYFGVGLKLMRNATATSSEHTYQEHSCAWGDFRVRCGMPVFLEHSRDSMTNAWRLFEYVVYAFATKEYGRQVSRVLCQRSSFPSHSARDRAEHYSSGLG